MPRARRCLLRPTLAALSLSLLLSTAQAETALFSTEGYRIGLYRSPTPTSCKAQPSSTPPPCKPCSAKPRARC